MIDLSKIGEKKSAGVNPQLLTNQEKMDMVGGNTRFFDILNAVIKCINYRDWREYVAFWDAFIQKYEDEAFRQGIKQAEKILKEGRGQPNV